MQKFLKFLKSNDREGQLILLVSILFTFGLFFHWLPQTQELMINMTQIFVFLVNSIALWFLHKTYQEKKLYYTWLGITFVVTLILEIIGSKTGLIFGNYWYGKTFSWQIFQVPVIIGLNWALIILSLTQAFVSKNPLKKPVEIFKNSVYVGFLAMWLDINLEPVAIKLDYWQWQNNIIPLQNYIAWFLIAFVFAYVYQLFNFKKIYISRYLIALYLIQLIFFSLLRFILPVF